MIKIVVERRPGHVLSVLNALEECKVEVMQSNVMTVGESSIHFVTVQVTARLIHHLLPSPLQLRIFLPSSCLIRQQITTTHSSKT